MDYRKLRYFKAVAEEGGFHQAAERLRVSQPALTRAIKELEVELGVRLLVRHSRGVDLTREGTILLSHARQLIRDVEVARNAVTSLGAEPRGLVSVGVPPSLSVPLLARLAERVSTAWPAIVLHFHERLMPDLPSMIAADRLDIVVVGSLRKSQRVNFMRLVDGPVVLVGHQRFPLCDRLTWVELPNFPLVISGSGADSFFWFEEAVRDRSVMHMSRFRVESPLLAIAIEESGLACAVLSRSTMPDAAATPECR